MTLQAELKQYRGVVCLHCKTPIPIPAVVGARESAVRGEDGAAILSQASSRVFTLRCHVCHKEKPYRTREIVDFEGSPEMQMPVPSPAYVRLPLSSDRAKTAKA
jgi:hypothetical protein